jgi:S1-C subfamily serine protease
MARSFGLAAPQGVVAAEVWPDSPAARAGIVAGDVIVQVNGQPVNDPTALNYAVATLAPGAQVSLLVRKAGGADHTVSVRLAPPPDSPAKDQRTIDGQNPLNGATVINLSPAAADELGLDPFAGTGVAVTGVGGYSARFLRPGDFVRQVNGQAITSVAQLVTALAAGRNGWVIVLERGGQSFTVQIQG